MIIEISIVSDFLGTRKPLPKPLAGHTGAMVEFTGIVRGNENGLPIGALVYEAYQPMAEQTMRTIIEDLGQRHTCLFVGVIHQIGTVPVGEAAVSIVACAAHRAAALGMVGDFMDRLKLDVPIWKTAALDTDGHPLPTTS
jgi:molybdopterin synthase catalytic subunit